MRTSTAGESAGDVLEPLLLTLSNGKFLALLSILFGVGLELQYRSAVRWGGRWPGRYPLRASLLFVEGALHYLLIFEFDVLMGYALVSVGVAFLVSRGDRVRRTWLTVSAVVHLAAVGFLTLALLTGNASLSSDRPALTASYATGSRADQVLARIELADLFRSELFLILPLSTVLFLAGIEVSRAGVFSDSERGVRLRSRLLRLGLGVRLPLNVVTALAVPEWFFVDATSCRRSSRSDFSPRS